MPDQLDLLDALELLCENNTSERTQRVLRLAIDEIERLRAIEIAALTLADDLTSRLGASASYPVPTADHPLIRAIRGRT